MTRAVWAAVLLLLTLASCSPDDGGDVVRGVVVDVTGSLQEGVSAFTVRDSDGTTWVFVPDEGLAFDDGAPLTHLSEHRTSGQPVEVEFVTLESGMLRAVRVADASG